MVVEGITRSKTVAREDWNVWIPKGATNVFALPKPGARWEKPPGGIRIRINKITLSAGDLLWRASLHLEWLLPDDATVATA